MLDRNKLSKQFDLVVQQEIKNHNDQMLHTNISINEIKSRLDELKNNHQLKQQNINEKISEFEFLLREFDIRFSALENTQRETKKLFEKSKVENENKHEEEYKYLEKIEKNQIFVTEYMFNLKESVKDLLTEFSGLEKKLDLKLDSWSSKLKKDFIRFRDDINSRPSELLMFREEFDDKIKVNKIDVEGILREILIFKKSTFAVEKQIENIYTLISRLQEVTKI